MKIILKGEKLMSNLDFIDIKDNKEYNKEEVIKLYNEAFPKDERIPIWLLKILVRKNKAKFYGIYDNEKFVGLVYNIFYKDIVFVFYLAIDKGNRGQGYGTKVLDSIKQKYKNSRIILCIEPVDENSDNYEQRVKRKNFYLKNGFEDFYYARIRERAKFILMGCENSCSSGFCVSMGTNRAENYDAYIKVDGERVYMDLKWSRLADSLAGTAAETADIVPDFATENAEKVTLPKGLSNESFDLEIWKEYGARCIGCGRCNFVCPTCTCFTMQDIFYKDNPKVGERRRVWASCQVDGYTDMAGGHSFRSSQADRMRFKIMHKIYDYEKRFGYPMCVGCGRCDDVCPEYISYSNCINRLAKEENEA
ncbi:MAG: anaerobic sulfite reductase subunit AsrA [Lachnospiraceae bacterium]